MWSGVQRAAERVGQRGGERAHADAQRRERFGRADVQRVHEQQWARRVPRHVDRLRWHELGEAVEVEVHAVAQRGQAGQVLVHRLAAVLQVEDGAPAGGAVAGGVERETERDRERVNGGSEGGWAQSQQAGRDRARGGERCGGDRGERVQLRRPVGHERRRRDAQPRAPEREPDGDGGQRGGDDDSENEGLATRRDAEALRSSSHRCRRAHEPSESG